MNRLALVAYPKTYRDGHGDELLACLTELHPGRAWPPLHEATALVRGGLRARVQAATAHGPWWVSGLQLAALWLTLLALTPYLQDIWTWALHLDPGSDAINFHFNGWYPWAIGEGTRTRLLPYGLLPLIAFIALLRGRTWIAVPAAAAMIYAGVSSSDVFGDRGVAGVIYYGLGAPILAHDIFLPVLLLGICAILAVANGSRRYSYGWLIPVVLAMFVAGGLHLTAGGPWFQRGQFVLELAVLIAAGWATITTRDYRWTIPVGAFAIVRTETILTDSTILTYHPQPSTTVLLALAVILPALLLATRSNTRLS
ncbi:hypothetical protein AB0P21_10265 [Kribbella sp. NPDC056861]|uniref:hypothetical protein n=1 Tax=Kribbella sp. NPDC056861 TaxID=3154857 RepID=UPI0034153315